MGTIPAVNRTVAAAREAKSQTRRAPVQERGRRRVQQLLDAAAEIVAESGVDNATTNAVAARAGTSVGVLYKFFPNKQAMVEALAERYARDIGYLLGLQEQQGIAQWPLQTATDWLVRATMEFNKAHPACQHVYRAVRGSSGEQSKILLDVPKRVINELLAQRLPMGSAEDREWHAITTVEVTQALVVQACMLPPAECERLIKETVTLLTRYLTPYYVPGAAASS